MSGAATLVAVMAAIYFSSGVLASLLRVSASAGLDQHIAIAYLAVFVLGGLSAVVAMFGQRFVFRRMIPAALIPMVPVWIAPGGYGMVNAAVISAPYYGVLHQAPFHLVVGVDFAPALLLALVVLTSFEALAPDELGGGEF